MQAQQHVLGHVLRVVAGHPAGDEPAESRNEQL
jgi:hypothetical protein